MKRTELIYLCNTYKLTETASVLERGSDEIGTYFILDRTIFYPQQGGQQCDIVFFSSSIRIIKYRLLL